LKNPYQSHIFLWPVDTHFVTNKVWAQAE